MRISNSSTSSTPPPSLPPPSGPHCLLPAAEATLLHMSAAPSGFGAVPLAYAKGSVEPRRGWRSTWRPAAAAAAAAAPGGAAAAPPSPGAAPSAAAAAPPPPASASAAPSSRATLPPPTKNVPKKSPSSAARSAAPFSRYPRKMALADLLASSSSSTQLRCLLYLLLLIRPLLIPAPYPGSSQQQIPVVYRSAPFRREAERRKTISGTSRAFFRRPLFSSLADAENPFCRRRRRRAGPARRRAVRLGAGGGSKREESSSSGSKRGRPPSLPVANRVRGGLRGPAG